MSSQDAPNAGRGESNRLFATLGACVRNPWISLTCVLALALGFRLADLTGVTLWGDEHYDLRISFEHAKSPNPFAAADWHDRDSVYNLDPSQARLPYYLTVAAIGVLSRHDEEVFLSHGGIVGGSALGGWIAFCVAVLMVSGAFVAGAPSPLGRWAGLLPLGGVGVLLGVLGLPRFPMEQVAAARVPAAIVGSLCIVPTYLLTRDIAGHVAGLFAATALALCPIHIGWSRCLGTTGDTYVTTCVMVMLWLLCRAVRLGSGRHVLFAATAFGLALGSKFSAVMLWPVCLVHIVLVWLAGIPVGAAWSADKSAGLIRRAALFHVGLLVPLAIVVIWGLPRFSHLAPLRLPVWLASFLLYAIGVGILARRPWHFARRHLFWVLVIVCVGALPVVAFASPYHLRPQVIFGLLAWYRECADPSGNPQRFFSELADMLSVLALAAKPAIVLLAAMGALVGLRSRNWGWFVLLATWTVVYLVAVALLHHKFNYYVMPLVPVLFVLAGVAVHRLAHLPFSRPISLMLAVGLACAAVGVNLHRALASHPHYLLEDEAWERALFGKPGPVPINLTMQPMRGIVRWLGNEAPAGSSFALVLPKPAREHPIISSFVRDVLAYELQRLPDEQADRVRCEVPTEAVQGSPYDLVGYISPTWAGKPTLPGYEECHCVRLIGKPVAWIYRRIPLVYVK